MGIKDNLEKAAAIFGATSEPRCVLMSEDTKYKMINDSLEITKHEFGDTVGFVECDGSELTLNCTGCNYVELYKDDAIAIAKVLGVTGEDLK